MLGKAIAAAAPALAAARVMAAEPKAAEPKAAEPQPAEPKPPEIKRKIKAGLIGCGGRGLWIAKLFQQHGGYELHAVADYFPQAADAGGNALGVDKARRFSGLSGYKKMLDSGVEAVVIKDVPYFYPEQAKAAVEAGCHVYMAKPVATDVPGCLMHDASAKLATQKKLCFLVDYQLPHGPANIEVATRVRDGALGPLAHIVSYGFSGAWGDPAKGPNIEGRLRGGVWLSDIALGGDNIVSYDIHIIDGVTWLMGRRPIAACGRSRVCRPNPHGDRTDCGAAVFEYEDGLLWTHLVQALNNDPEIGSLKAIIHGASATAQIAYWGKVYVRGGPKHYVGDAGSIYDLGATRNIADFYRSIVDGHFENPTAQRAVDGHLTAILGREASASRRYLTMEELIKENKRLEVDLSGLKA
jgi:predicted dehydrogenase